MAFDQELLTNVRNHAGEYGQAYAGMCAVHNGMRVGSIRRSGHGTEGNHAEKQIIDRCEDWMQKALMSAGGTLEELQFFTSRSPCEKCTPFLVDFRRHFAKSVTTWRLGWDEEWIPNELLNQRDANKQALTARQTALATANSRLPPAQAALNETTTKITRLQTAFTNLHLTPEGRDNINNQITVEQATRAARNRALAEAKLSVTLATAQVTLASEGLAAANAKINAHNAQQAVNRADLVTAGWTVTQE